MTRSTAVWAAVVCSLGMTVSIGGCKGGKNEGTIVGRIFEAKALAPEEAVIVVAKIGDEEVGRATTDAQGRFELKVPSDREVVVEMIKADRVTGLEVIAVPKGERAQFEGKMLPTATRQTRDANTTIVVRSQRGASAKIPASSLRKADGTMPVAMVDVKVTPIEPRKRDELDAMPGKAMARNGSAPGPDPLMEIVAAMIVEASEGADPLDLAAGTTMEIRVPVSDPLAPSTVEVFALDEATGAWVSIGFGRKQRDGEGNEVYVVEVDRLGPIALARLRPAGCVHGCIDGGAGARVTSTGISAPFFATAVAGTDGCFRIDAPIGRPVQIFASTATAASVPTTATATGGDPDAGPVELASCDDVGTIVVDPTNLGDATCPLGYARCGTECVDLTSDDARCGSCTNACAVGDRCIAGACGCSSTSMICGTTCTSVDSDAVNCGTCGNPCAAMQECIDGGCQNVACSTPFAFCGSYCVDLQTDDANCGSCGNVCADVQMCVTGGCGGGGFVQPVGDVSGNLVDDDTGAALSGMLVRVLGTNPPIQAMTDPLGDFTLTSVPAGLWRIETMIAGYWGHVREVTVVPEGTIGLSTWRIKPDAQIAAIETALSRTLDRTRGIVYASFDLAAALPMGGESLSIMPASATLPFTRNMAGTGWVEAGALQAGGVDTKLWFADVLLPMTTVAPVGTASRPCVLRSQPSQNVVGGSITEVDVACRDVATLTGTVCSVVTSPCTPVPNATVEILGVSPVTTTTTNAAGQFTLSVPADLSIELRVSATGYWASAYRVFVSAGGLDLLLSLLTDAAYDGRLSTVGRAANPSSGTIVVTVNAVSGTGVERGVLSAPSEPTLVPADPNGTPTVSPTLLPGIQLMGGGGYFEFNGVPPGTVVANVLGAGCGPSDGDYTVRSMPKTISYVDYSCD